MVSKGGTTAVSAAPRFSSFKANRWVRMAPFLFAGFAMYVVLATPVMMATSDTSLMQSMAFVLGSGIVFSVFAVIVLSVSRSLVATDP